MTAKHIVMHQHQMQQFNIAEAKSKFSEWPDAAAQRDGYPQSRHAMLLPSKRGQHAPIRRVGSGTLKDKIRIGENFDSPLPDDAAGGKKAAVHSLSGRQSEIAS
jgi:hypothetical protein